MLYYTVLYINRYFDVLMPYEYQIRISPKYNRIYKYDRKKTLTLSTVCPA